MYIIYGVIKIANSIRNGNTFGISLKITDSVNVGEFPVEKWVSIKLSVYGR